jgi:hypothetical protein
MLQDFRSIKWTRAAAVAALLLISQAALAEIIFLTGEAPIDGVDAIGNRDPGLGALVPGIVLKDTDTGFIAQILQGFVTNESGERAVFTNFGSQIFDPETQEFVTATIDILRVGPQGRARQFSVKF